MPVCPKCHKLISPKNYSRHLKRCGVTHKRGPKALTSGDNFFMRI
jgi:hypothetical protein